ncbi:hypothetical protein PHLGIDRAFT_89189 [Phlebiopsis gigantea 11061_1 CR5-6]|uniref:Uncharacterized protein n=1 Tax=Phlebiopsis gigantea (strain 11061_1 CR5-6) TaxID=745531 RepID=A0A0C3PM64_PHLG1|nr:hypothetical protein PHLGIDRAFT_89189 [Phlebiopsis gigantea 11061_1 CR5-6]
MSTPPTSSHTCFEDALATAILPEPGPAYFDARRQLWKTFRGTEPAQAAQPSARMQRLRAMLSNEGLLESDEYWNAGLGKFWNGLMSGQRIRERLPLRDLVKVLQIGWIRDGTWPKGQVAPEPDDELKADETPLSPTATDASRFATRSTPETPADEGS